MKHGLVFGEQINGSDSECIPVCIPAFTHLMQNSTELFLMPDFHVGGSNLNLCYIKPNERHVCWTSDRNPRMRVHTHKHTHWRRSGRAMAVEVGVDSGSEKIQSLKCRVWKLPFVAWGRYVTCCHPCNSYIRDSGASFIFQAAVNEGSQIQAPVKPKKDL